MHKISTCINMKFMHEDIACLADYFNITNSTTLNHNLWILEITVISSVNHYSQQISETQLKEELKHKIRLEWPFFGWASFTFQPTIMESEKRSIK